MPRRASPVALNAHAWLTQGHFFKFVLSVQIFGHGASIVAAARPVSSGSGKSAPITAYYDFVLLQGQNTMLGFQRFTLAALALSCVSCATPVPPVPEELRPHDSRVFTPPAIGNSFAAMAALPLDAVNMASSSRWAGVLKGAAFMVEVPANWNGKLVMFAHGYAGTGSALSVAPPAIRRHLIQSGYAWAASSYSTNFYDVRAGVEDTNSLALAFNAIAVQNGRPLAAPVRIYITGRSMGGHIAAAAV